MYCSIITNDFSRKQFTALFVFITKAVKTNLFLRGKVQVISLQRDCSRVTLGLFVVTFASRIFHTIKNEVKIFFEMAVRIM